ncbi:hypothetical protein P280DRAFT_54169 [Massarina eburnea CBS 473.64]|uniref:Uncharacterized protein n=1 Tax=Massarina eburnea CBS 473.64 TaxID=1395130 RepID=A0A6A6RWJ6_9PLEO|nr:hypothetical protein P280DRAFT_54169 [Massarina eburnea CBS 473.64]
MATETKRDSMEASLSELKSTISSTHITSPESPKRPISFTSLPSSLRNKIYAYVLDTELVNVGAPNVSYTHSIKDSVLHFKASRPPFPVETALFYVSKQVSKEALQFFYERGLWVKFTVYSPDARHTKTMLEDSGVLFSVAENEKVEECNSHAMDIVLVEKSSAVKRATVMFPAQYLPRLVNFMEQASRASGSWAASHALYLTLRNTYEKEVASVQGDLLEGWRLLTGMGKVGVDKDNTLEGYAEGLEDSMLAAGFDAEKWLETVRGMVTKAEDAKHAKDYETAAQHCKAAIISMTYGYLTRAESLHSQPEAFHKSIQRLRYTTELTLGTSLLAPHTDLLTTTPLSWLSTLTLSRAQTATRLLAAEIALSRALSISTDSPSPASNPWYRSLPPELIPPNNATWFSEAEQGRSWFERGRAHLALGEPLFAAGDLERAERMLQGDKEVGETFERARETIDWSTSPGCNTRLVARAARADHWIR